MQSMPLLLRQTFKSPGFSTLSRTSSTTAASTTSSTATATARHPLCIPSAAPRPLFLHAGRGAQTTRGFSVCRRCQFRTHQNLFSSSGDTKGESNNVKDGDDVGGATGKETKEHHDDGRHHLHGPSMTLPQEGDFPKYSDIGVEGQKDSSVAGSNFVMQTSEENGGPNGNERKRSRLPSNLENRRSRYSKQFSEMMDNLQSNVFVAGQRLNDLTGYSSIEALKNEIQHQEDRLRTARRHVREAKDDYAAAINRRSTSQREVNELLQRKHAWSSADLERFTSLYRNDHTNEVAEHEAQEALSKAEREAEEAAGKLSKNILSRYHEEQVWSDKIRRMSTWGTWGLMGVNVLLFLIFQIGVEPWRRKRLVKGFEEKVIEALEKDKSQHPHQIVTSAQIEDSTDSTTPSTATITTTSADQIPTSSDEPAAAAQDNPTTADSEQNQFTLEYVKPHRLFSHITPPSTSVESWRQTLHDLLSDRTFFVTQRDLTAVAIQSAAAGAAVMGFVIALIRPR